MSFNKCFADSEAEAGAAGTLPTTICGAIEALEDMWQFVGSDARPIIGNRDDNLIVLLAGCDPYCSLTIDLRVGDQVVEDNLNARVIDVDQGQISRQLYG